MRRLVPAPPRSAAVNRRIARLPVGGPGWLACAAAAVSCVVGLTMATPGLLVGAPVHDDHPTASGRGVRAAYVRVSTVPPASSPAGHSEPPAPDRGSADEEGGGDGGQGSSRGGGPATQKPAATPTATPEQPALPTTVPPASPPPHDTDDDAPRATERPDEGEGARDQDGDDRTEDRDDGGGAAPDGWDDGDAWHDGSRGDEQDDRPLP